MEHQQQQQAQIHQQQAQQTLIHQSHYATQQLQSDSAYVTYVQNAAAPSSVTQAYPDQLTQAYPYPDQHQQCQYTHLQYPPLPTAQPPPLPNEPPPLPADTTRPAPPHSQPPPPAPNHNQETQPPAANAPAQAPALAPSHTEISSWPPAGDIDPGRGDGGGGGGEVRGATARNGKRRNRWDAAEAQILKSDLYSAFAVVKILGH